MAALLDIVGNPLLQVLQHLGPQAAAYLACTCKALLCFSDEQGGDAWSAYVEEELGTATAALHASALASTPGHTGRAGRYWRLVYSSSQQVDIVCWWRAGRKQLQAASCSNLPPTASQAGVARAFHTATLAGHLLVLIGGQLRDGAPRKATSVCVIDLSTLQVIHPCIAGTSPGPCQLHSTLLLPWPQPSSGTSCWEPALNKRPSSTGQPTSLHRALVQVLQQLLPSAGRAAAPAATAAGGPAQGNWSSGAEVVDARLPTTSAAAAAVEPGVVGPGAPASPEQQQRLDGYRRWLDQPEPSSRRSTTEAGTLPPGDSGSSASEPGSEQQQQQQQRGHLFLVLGGLDGRSMELHLNVLDCLWLSDDGRDGVWFQVQIPPAAGSFGPPAAPSPRAGAAAHLLTSQQQVLLYGGSGPEAAADWQQDSDTVVVHLLDLHTLQWRVQHTSAAAPAPGGVGGGLPGVRSSAVTALARRPRHWQGTSSSTLAPGGASGAPTSSSSDPELLVVLGGRDDAGGIYDGSPYALDLSLWRWHAIPAAGAAVPSPRWGAAACNFGGRWLLCYGGTGERGEFLASVDCFDLVNLQWSGALTVQGRVGRSLPAASAGCSFEGGVLLGGLQQGMFGGVPSPRTEVLLLDGGLSQHISDPPAPTLAAFGAGFIPQHATTAAALPAAAAASSTAQAVHGTAVAAAQVPLAGLQPNMPVSYYYYGYQPNGMQAGGSSMVQPQLAAAQGVHHLNGIRAPGGGIHLQQWQPSDAELAMRLLQQLPAGSGAGIAAPHAAHYGYQHAGSSRSHGFSTVPVAAGHAAAAAAATGPALAAALVESSPSATGAADASGSGGSHSTTEGLAAAAAWQQAAAADKDALIAVHALFEDASPEPDPDWVPVHGSQHQGGGFAPTSQPERQPAWPAAAGAHSSLGGSSPHALVSGAGAGLGQLPRCGASAGPSYSNRELEWEEEPGSGGGPPVAAVDSGVLYPGLSHSCSASYDQQSSAADDSESDSDGCEPGGITLRHGIRGRLLAARAYQALPAAARGGVGPGFLAQGATSGMPTQLPQQVWPPQVHRLSLPPQQVHAGLINSSTSSSVLGSSTAAMLLAAAYGTGVSDTRVGGSHPAAAAAVAAATLPLGAPVGGLSVDGSTASGPSIRRRPVAAAAPAAAGGGGSEATSSAGPADPASGAVPSAALQGKGEPGGLPTLPATFALPMQRRLVLVLHALLAGTMLLVVWHHWS